MKFSALAFLLEAFSTRSSIFATVLSPNSFSTLILSTPLRFTQPLGTLSPAHTLRGILSPVRAAVFRVLAPSITVPSRGIFSPGFTTMISPIATSSGSA